MGGGMGGAKGGTGEGLGLTRTESWKAGWS